MKVELNKTGKVQERPFPKLMVTKSGCLVLMYRYGIGTLIIDTEDMETDIGQSIKTWLMDKFQDFEGSITISNE